MRGAGYISLCSGILSGLLFSCLLLLSFHGKSPYQQYTTTTTTSDHSISLPPTSAPLGGSTRKRLISYNVLLGSSLDIVQAIKDTWARDTEHLHFYYKSEGDQNGLPKSVIKLENQPYSLLALLKHICEREQGDFFWYAIVSGSTYIKVSRLENILRSLSTSKPLMLGHIELFMQWDEPTEVYCSEMGVILNRAVLNGVCGRINQCKNDPAQISEALQLSRCIYQISNITCKEPVQVRIKLTYLFYHSFYSLINSFIKHKINLILMSYKLECININILLLIFFFIILSLTQIIFIISIDKLFKMSCTKHYKSIHTYNTTLKTS